MAGDLNQSIRAKSRRGDVPWKQMRGINLDFTGRVRYIEKNYRTKNDRDSRAIVGFSRGGNQALFSIPFIDDLYTIAFSHDDPLLRVAVDPAQKRADLCGVTVLDDVGLPVTVPIAYVAIGRWK